MQSTDFVFLFSRDLWGNYRLIFINLINFNRTAIKSKSNFTFSDPFNLHDIFMIYDNSITNRNRMKRNVVYFAVLFKSIVSWTGHVGSS